MSVATKIDEYSQENCFRPPRFGVCQLVILGVGNMSRERQKVINITIIKLRADGYIV